jgi:hypothetical protein
MFFASIYIVWIENIILGVPSFFRGYIMGDPVTKE